MSDTAPIVFTVNELWLLQRCVKHEMQGQKDWKFPPANHDLNDSIAEALLFCTDENVTEAALILSWGDCLTIDFAVSSDAKDVNGKPIGREVLLKTYRARRAIRRALPVGNETYVEPLTRAEVVAKLAATTVENSEEKRDDATTVQQRDGSSDDTYDYPYDFSF